MKFLASLLAVAAVAAAPTATAQFTVTGAGGPIAPLNFSSGNNCDTLPDDIVSFPAGAAVPMDATGITSVTLTGLTHTWVGDVHVVLRSPDGSGYNLIAPIVTSGSTSCTTGGDSSDYGGTYTVRPACDAPLLDFETEAGAAVLASGDYAQYFGLWVDGADGVSNVDISGIPALPGIWTLEIYDGAGGDTGALVEWSMSGTTRDAGQTVGGPGGPIPLADTGTSGDRCSILPTDGNSFFATTPVMGGTSIESVTLTGLTHTWVGDLQIVLVNPSGTIGYNLCARINSDTMGCTGFGDSSDFSGDYTFVPAGNGGDILADATANSTVTPGDYDQFYGVWIDGSSSVFNTDLADIPLEDGVWILAIFDGGGGDVGDLVEWSMNVAGATADDVCAGELNSTGAAADFSVSGSPSVSANDLMLHVTDLPMGSFGFFLVGDECVNVPGIGGGMGTLCVGGDLRRGVGNAILNSGMTGTVDIAADLMNIPTTGFGNPSGVAATAYQRLFIQYWYRDVDGGGMTTSNLSNALLVVPTM